MSELSDYLANAILGFFDGVNMPAAPAGVYVALYDGDPGQTGTGGTDVTTTVNAAGRVQVSFGAAAGRVIENDAAVDFGTADAAANITHFGLWDAQAGGNFLGGDALQTPRTVALNDPVSFLVGDLSVSFAYAG